MCMETNALHTLQILEDKMIKFIEKFMVMTS